MRRILFLTAVVLLFGSFSFDDNNPETDYEPVLMQRTELVKSVSMLAPRSPKSMDKIYVKDKLLLVTEKYKGVHIFNNANPAAPVNIGFLRIPGCVDVAMRGSVLYADNATDLVAINLSNLNDIKVCSRVEGTLPELTPPDCNYVPSSFSTDKRPANTVIVEWVKTIKK